MPNTPRPLKKKLGALLLKIQEPGHGLDENETELAKILESKFLAKYLGPPEEGPRQMSMEEYRELIQNSALASWTLTGMGLEVVHTTKRDDLLEGRFYFAGETPWYDQWPYKLLWPALVSVVTTATLQYFKSTK